ncbi:MAG: hypothetical protein WC301_05815 [Candidatus Omnitrophota bacterium]
MSKSLINNVIKEKNLSGPVGRRKEREDIPVEKPPEPRELPPQEVPETPAETTQELPPPAPSEAPAEKPPEPKEPPPQEEPKPLPSVTQELPPKEPPPQEVPETPAETTQELPPPAPSEAPAEKPPEIEKKPLEIIPISVIKQETDFMENGGFFFLKAADLKLGLTPFVADILSGYLPGLAKEDHIAIIESFLYSPFFKEKNPLWLLIGKGIPEQDITQYSQHIEQIPIAQLASSFTKLDIILKTNEINELWQGCLLRLNSYITQLFPPEYHTLDFTGMRQRFYSLPARLQATGNLLMIQLFYPNGFFWMNDIIWQEGFSCAANRINETRIMTASGLQIWVSPQVQFI